MRPPLSPPLAALAALAALAFGGPGASAQAARPEAHLHLIPRVERSGAPAPTMLVARPGEGAATPALRVPHMPEFVLACYPSGSVDEHLAVLAAEAAALQARLDEATRPPVPDPPAPPAPDYHWQRFADGRLACRERVTGRLAAQALCREAGAPLPP